RPIAAPAPEATCCPPQRTLPSRLSKSGATASATSISKRKIRGFGPAVEVNGVSRSHALSGRRCQRATASRTLWPLAHCGNRVKISCDGRGDTQVEDSRHQELPHRGHSFQGHHHAAEGRPRVCLRRREPRRPLSGGGGRRGGRRGVA